MQPLYCTPVGDDDSVEVLWKDAEESFADCCKKMPRVTGHSGAAHPTFREHKSSRKRIQTQGIFRWRAAAAPGGTGVIRRANSDRLKRVSHAGRLATMGHLAASVAHEIN